VAESIAAAITALIGFVVWLIRRQAGKADDRKPQEEEAQRDADLVNPDPGPLTVRLQRLMERARGRRPRKPSA